MYLCTAEYSAMILIKQELIFMNFATFFFQKIDLLFTRVGASTSTQYLGTSTLKMFKYKYKYRVLRNVLGYYPSTLQMY